MVKTIIFDLDGTLLNTLGDLNNALNHTLSYFYLPNVTINQTKSYIGNGVKKLIERAINGASIDKDLAYEVFKKYYRNHIKDYTIIYDGILDLLKVLKENNINIAIASNKYQEGVEQLTNHLLMPYIDICVGSSEKVKVKPSPDMVNIILKHFNEDKKNCLFVGDSDVDIKTGRTNNIKTVGVTWGYKDVDVIKNEGPDYIINSPLELLEIIKEINNND